MPKQPSIQFRDPEIPGQAQRLNIIYKEFIKSNPYGIKYRNGFADLVSIHDSSFSKMLRGLIPINKKTLDFVTLKLGYNSDWLLRGVGERRDTGKEKSLATDVKMLQGAIDILRNELKLEATKRRGLEKELEQFKKEIRDMLNPHVSNR